MSGGKDDRRKRARRREGSPYSPRNAAAADASDGPAARPDETKAPDGSTAGEKGPTPRKAARKRPANARQAPGDTVRTTRAHADIAPGTPVSGPAQASNLFVVFEALRARYGWSFDESLGDGGFGYVFAVTIGNVARAVKISKQRIGPQNPQAFRELKALKETLGHPRLLHLVQFGMVEGHLITVWERAECTLEDKLREHQRRTGAAGLPLKTTVRWIREAAEAIDFLNQRGIYHRDIKPQNLFLLHGHVKVGDMGLVKFAGMTTTKQTIAGTRGYLPPEAWGQTWHRSIDIYGLAATYVRLRTGRAPFGETDDEIFQRSKMGQFERSGLTRAEIACLEEALSPDPHQRPESAVEWVRRLTRELKREQSGFMTPMWMGLRGVSAALGRILRDGLADECTTNAAGAARGEAIGRPNAPPPPPGGFGPDAPNAPFSSPRWPPAHGRPPVHPSGQPLPHPPPLADQVGGFPPQPQPPSFTPEVAALPPEVAALPPVDGRPLPPPGGWQSPVAPHGLAQPGWPVDPAAGGPAPPAQPPNGIGPWPASPPPAHTSGTPSRRRLRIPRVRLRVLLWLALLGLVGGGIYHAATSPMPFVFPPPPQPATVSLTPRAASSTVTMLCARFSPDGRRIVTGAKDGTVCIWDARSAQRLLVLKGHKDAVNCVRFFPDGNRVLSVSADATARVWDLESYQELVRFEAHKGEILWGTISPDGQRVATVSQRDSSFVWDSHSGKVVAKLEVPRAVSAEFGSIGTRIVAIERDNRSGAVLEADTGAIRTRFGIESGSLVSAYLVEDDHVIMGFDNRGSIIRWDASSGEQQSFQEEALRKSGNTLTYACLSRDGRTIAGCFAGWGDLQVCLWDIETEAITRTISVRSDGLYGSYCHLAPDGKRVLVVDHRLVLTDLSGTRPAVECYQFERDSWLAMTPQGFFAGSKDAPNFVKHVNAEDEPLPAEESRRYFRPDVVKGLIAHPEAIPLPE